MKFHSKPIEEHNEVPLADEGQWDDLVAHFTERQASSVRPRNAENSCYVVSVGTSASASATPHDAQLEEILGLVQAQGDRVVGYETLRRPRPDPKTYVGLGAARSIATRAKECGADLLVIDAALSPSQARNLEDAAAVAVCDREAVILNVFGRHAKTRRARIQVEIAHLEYLRPRIRGLGLTMDQQAGGVMRGRGPGETASELLARQLDGRLVELRKQFARLTRAGTIQRKGRQTCARIVLVGYTNAGKTSLMNGLTSAGLSARDLPFETLDTTSRCLTRHGGDVILSDTVGFIRRLPDRLLASFESTLAEIREASLVVPVVDTSDPEWGMHLRTTEVQLARLGAGELPRLYVFNKMDRVPVAPPDCRLRMLSGGHDFVALSSHDPEALDRLRPALIEAARADHRRVRLFVPYRASALMQRVYAECRVDDTQAVEHGLVFTIQAAPHIIRALQCDTTRLQS